MKILLSKNMNIIKEYLKENLIVGFVSTASELYEDRWYMEEDKENLTKMNYKLIDIDISKESKDDILNKLSNIDAIFISGGNAFYLLHQLKQKELLEYLINFANEKVYIGSSAGACIACPSIKYLEKLDDILEAPLLEDCNAMNLVDFYILPHYKSKEKYTKIADKIEREYNYEFIKLTNEQAIIVKDNNYTIVSTE